MMSPASQVPAFQAAAEAGAWLRACLGQHANLTMDSRHVARGDGFLAAPGLRVDGRQFVTDALRRGAAAVLSQADEQDNSAAGTGLPVPHRRLPDLARQAGEVAAAFYGNPSAAMQVLAVTGTNGKTSCASWFADGAADAGAPAAAIGTLGVVTYGTTAAASLQADGVALTTPDAVSMQRVLAGLARQGVATVALEASSIGLHQGRLAGVQIDAAIFTNLTRDHLDYHGSFEQYQQAKAQLFQTPGLKIAIVNGDDPAAEAMLAAVEPGVRTIAYGSEPGRFGHQADEQVSITAITANAAGMRLTLAGAFGPAQLQLNMIGRFNAFNAAAVWAAWCAFGVAPDQAAVRLGQLASVPGRMQLVQQADAPLVVIDFAHTPDALSAALQALTDQAAARGGRLWCVFGCGGDRDPGKRPEMAAAAQAVADCLVLTSDNPRSEAPATILQQMQAGLSAPAWLVEADRRVAVTAAVQAADANDIILVAGKGHENYQDINGVRTPFLDEAVATDALRARAAARGGADV